MITDIRKDFWIIMIEINLSLNLQKKRYKRIFINLNTIQKKGFNKSIFIS